MPSVPARTVDRRRLLSLVGVGAASLGVVSLAGCAALDDVQDSSTADSPAGGPASTGIWDPSMLHVVTVEVDESALADLVATYQDSGDKEWVEATVTVDGTTVQRAGMRLKGNSSLRGVSADADPTDLPWLIRLDKFVDGQTIEGWSQLVVRSNGSTTALNEAVALDLLGAAGLATEAAVATSFSVNGTGPVLRLVLQNLDEAWEAATFTGPGLLYKAEAGGDWSYRGDDPDAYDEVFDQETGEDDLTPLTDFLRFLDESGDETFAAELPDRLDVDAFARYLAFEDFVDNFDDIDGPGNNAFLRWDSDAERFTVVAWDHNLAFGGSPGGGRAGGGGRGPGQGGQDGQLPQRPEGMQDEMPGGMPTTMPSGMPDGADGQGAGPGGAGPGGAGGGRGGPGAGSNPLVERFRAVQEWSDLVDTATTELTADLYTSGHAAEVLDARVAVLTEQAGDLVDADTVEQEASSVRDYFS